MLGPEEEDELVASEGSLSELRGMSGTICGGDSGRGSAGAAGAAGAGGGCAICNGTAKYGAAGSKAGWNRGTAKFL